MSITESDIRQVLAKLTDPEQQIDYQKGDSLKKITIDDTNVTIDMVCSFPVDWRKTKIQNAIVDVLRAEIQGIGNVNCSVSTRIQTHAVQRGVTPLSGVHNIIAVASGKGGVGKSTTAANLALALLLDGATVGLLDADIYGPSQPQMLGIAEAQPESVDGKGLEPLEVHGIQVMSIGFLIDVETPMIWRGPMVTQALQQLLHDTNWKALDYLIVDMPPGTGDIQLTLTQNVPVTGAVIVTTPQDIALLDARKGLKMFEKVNVPIIGLIENMAIYTCEQCGHQSHIFGSGGGENMCADYNTPFLGALPLAMPIRVQADAGLPIVLSDADGEHAGYYRKAARQMALRIAQKNKDFSSRMPKIVVEKDS